MSMRMPVSPNSFSAGFTSKTVQIQGIDDKGLAECIDGAGQLLKISIHTMRTKSGELPQVGETWFIDRQYGTWSFGAINNYMPPQGIVTFTTAMTGFQVLLSQPQPDANYAVLLTPSWNTRCWFSNVLTDRFDLHTETSPGSNSPVAWKLLRQP